MVYPYMVKYNGAYYLAGENVPDGEKAQNEPLSEKVDKSPSEETKAVESAKKPIRKAKKEV